MGSIIGYWNYRRSCCIVVLNTLHGGLLLVLIISVCLLVRNLPTQYIHKLARLLADPLFSATVSMFMRYETICFNFTFWPFLRERSDRRTFASSPSTSVILVPLLQALCSAQYSLFYDPDMGIRFDRKLPTNDRFMVLRYLTTRYAIGASLWSVRRREDLHSTSSWVLGCGKMIGIIQDINHLTRTCRSLYRVDGVQYYSK
ncbi:hypothetical protein RvY_19574, partial [Ramazzottius varieornatus]